MPTTWASRDQGNVQRTNIASSSRRADPVEEVKEMGIKETCREGQTSHPRVAMLTRSVEEVEEMDLGTARGWRT